MADMQKLLVMAFMISGIMLGFSGLMTSWTGQYGTTVQGLESSSIISRTFNQTEALKTNIQGTSISAADPVNSFLVFTNSAIQGVTLLANIPAIFITLIADFSGRVNIFPAWFTDVLIGVLFVSVTIAMLFYILKVKA